MHCFFLLKYIFMTAHLRCHPTVSSSFCSHHSRLVFHTCNTKVCNLYNLQNIFLLPFEIYQSITTKTALHILNQTNNMILCELMSQSSRLPCSSFFFDCQQGGGVPHLFKILLIAPKRQITKSKVHGRKNYKVLKFCWFPFN